MEEITINRGTRDVIIDIEDLIDLLEYKLIALNKYTGVEHIDEHVIHINKTILQLQEYLSSL